MDIMFALASMCLLCGGIGFYAALRNRADERRVVEEGAVPAHVRREGDSSGRALALALSAIVTASWIALPMHAQEVVHARTGQVVAVNAAAHTLALKVADGSTVVFHDMASPGPALSFAKELRDKTVPAAAFDKVGSQAVVFYFGYGDLTAVAVKELGADPVVKSTGSVAGFDRHQHLLTLRTESAGPEKLMLTPDTVVDTSDGVVRLADYRPSKGEQLRCFTRPKSEDALLVAPN